jgi:hypothetical protein
LLFSLAQHQSLLDFYEAYSHGDASLPWRNIAVPKRHSSISQSKPERVWQQFIITGAPRSHKYMIMPTHENLQIKGGVVTHMQNKRKELEGSGWCTCDPQGNQVNAALLAWFQE